jgi:hypothetical protein
MRVTRSVFVAYEDSEARRKAAEFCDGLIKRFWTQSEFELSWRAFSELEDPGLAKEAAARAATAELVVFACHHDTDWSEAVQRWLETWPGQRDEREGALAALIDSEREISAKHVYLRAVAHRAGMDYLTQVPQEMAFSFPESLDAYSERASQMTGVLEGILHHHPAPPRI